MLDRSSSASTSRRVVNKYLGETEKNLDRGCSRAPRSSTSALLLDEGDALMTRRTDVQTSNDRYANPRDHFLLQRSSSYEGFSSSRRTPGPHRSGI